MKTILDFISSFCPITGNNLADTIIFAFIAFVSFVVAWILTGFISDLIDSRDSDEMSSLHWIIRIVVFVVLLLAVLRIIDVVRWIGGWPWWVYLAASIVFIHALGLVIALFIKKSKKRKKHRQTQESENG